MNWSDVRDVGAGNFVPPYAICPKPQDVGQVAVWDGGVVEVFQYEMLLPHVYGHTREGMEDLSDFVDAQEVASWNQADKCEVDGNSREWSVWNWGSLARRSDEWRGWAVRRFRIRGCWKVGSVGSSRR